MDKCNALELLKKHNLKSTRQRITLLNTILEIDSVFSAKTLFDKLEDKMDLVTIYRILEALQTKSIIRDVLSPDESKLYELSCKHNPVHPHLKCSECEKILCLEELDEDFYTKLVNEYPKYLIEDITIQFNGKCPVCKNSLD